MFTGKEHSDSPYDSMTHLSEIVDLFGPLPKSLLAKGDREIVDRVCNEDGTIKGFDYVPGPGLDDGFYMEELQPEARQAFLSFLHALMKLDPAERLPIQELVDHVWIKNG